MPTIIEDIDATALSTIYTLDIGDTFSGSLEGAASLDDHITDQSDYIRFNVLAGDTIAFAAMYLTGDYFFDIGVSVLDEEGNGVARPDFSGVGNNSSYTFLESGTYYARISIGDLFDNGTYEFTTSYVDTPTEVEYVTPIDSYEGEIAFLGERDLLNINVESGSSYRIAIEPVDSDSFDEDSFFDGLIRGAFVVSDSDNNIVGATGEVDSSTQDHLIFTADVTETLTVEVGSRLNTDVDFDTGDYRIILDRIDTIHGSEIDDTLIGTTASNGIYGQGGNDIVEANSGDDVVAGGAGDDLVSAISGSNVINGGDDDDIIRGGFDNDQIFGDAGDDILLGDNNVLIASSDRLHGGTGDDLLEGGGGADTFSFRVNEGNDTIGVINIDFENHANSTVTGPDFVSGMDMIVLTGFGFVDAEDAFDLVADVDGVATFSDQGTTITFAGLSVAELSADDFQIL